jgi:glycosyltransferase involved in cell wall biosynthesis
MRLTYLVNHVAFFVSHRLPIALAMRATGHEVSLVTGQLGSPVMEARAVAELTKTGMAHTRLAFGSQSINPVTEARGLLGLILHLRRTRPDLLHCASPKGVLYGGIAARLCGVPAIVFAVSGMGYAFTDTERASPSRQLLSAAFTVFARFAFGHRNKRVIVQNRDDWDHFLRQGYARADELCLIPGSGVDLIDFAGLESTAKQQIVVFPARILRDKGAFEFVEAARLLRNRAPGWRFVMAGSADYQNPSSIDRAVIEAWQAEGVIEWLGHVDDMVALFGIASIACLPSYREGMPKALIEAAAAGCAVVTTDVIGCREVIVPCETGNLVPVRDAKALAAALYSLIVDPERRKRYGRAGAALAKARYSLGAVIEATRVIYAALDRTQGTSRDA